MLKSALLRAPTPTVSRISSFATISHSRPCPPFTSPPVACVDFCRFSQKSAARLSGGIAPTQSAGIRRRSPWGKHASWPIRGGLFVVLPRRALVAGHSVLRCSVKSKLPVPCPDYWTTPIGFSSPSSSSTHGFLFCVNCPRPARPARYFPNSFPFMCDVRTNQVLGDNSTQSDLYGCAGPYYGLSG